MTVPFPVYVIANNDGVLIVRDDDQQCILLFHRREHAERHIAETRTLGSTLPLFPLAVPDAKSLREGLQSLPADIKCAVWDASLAVGQFNHVGIDELLTDTARGERFEQN